MAYTGSIPIPPESEEMRRATYDDVLNAPEKEVLRLREGAWTIVTVLAASEPCRVEPFDAVELELGALWP